MSADLLHRLVVAVTRLEHAIQSLRSPKVTTRLASQSTTEAALVNARSTPSVTTRIEARGSFPLNDPVAFRREVDRLLLAGVPPMRIADRFGIRDRGVRRRRQSLLAEGHVIPRTAGAMPEENHDTHNQPR